MPASDKNKYECVTQKKRSIKISIINNSLGICQISFVENPSQLNKWRFTELSKFKLIVGFYSAISQKTWFIFVFDEDKFAAFHLNQQCSSFLKNKSWFYVK